MHRVVSRYATAAAAAFLVGGTLAVFASVTPASAAKALTDSVTFKVSNADIYDNGYNQSYTSVLTASDTTGPIPAIPTLTSVTPGTLGTSFTNGFYCGAPTTYDVVSGSTISSSCTIEAAPGFGDDVNIVGASGTSNTVGVSDTDNSSNVFTGSETMIIYPAPVCGAAPDSGGTLSGTNDTIYSANSGANTVAQACFDGADTNPTGVGSANSQGSPYNVSNSPASPWTAASTLILGLNNTSGAGSTIFTGSNAIDAAGGTALTIEAGPGFNWTGGVGSGEADVDTGTAGLSKQAWSGGSLTAAPPSTTADMSASTVDGYNTTTQFKSSGDPADQCPPAQALIDAGLPFCFDEFETTGSGPSATQIAVGFSGQNLPTSQAPTAQLSSSSGAIGQTVTVTDATGACPATIGGLGAGAANLFSATNNCWYARAGDPTPVSVTVDNIPATVTPNPTQTTVSGVSVTSGSEVTTITPPNAFPTNLLGDLVTDSAGDIPAGTTVTGQGNGTTGDYAAIELTLSNGATATDASDTLTFTNNSDVSEADYSVDNVSTTTSLDGADSTITLVHENATNQVTTCVGSGSPTGCTGASAGTAATPYDLVGDSVSGTGIPVGTEVTAQSGTSPTTLTLSNSTLAADSGDNETLTFYQVILNPPQLNANFTIPAGTPTGPQTVDVCEATTPNNGNDWEFGVQWLSAQGSLTNIAGDSPTQTQICATTTIDVGSSSTTSTPASSSIVLGNSNSDGVVVTGNAIAGSPTGTVSFYECGSTPSPTPCTSQANPVGSAETLTAGAGNTSSTNSVSFTPDSTGYWCFGADYSGDSNYAASADTSTDECFDVTDASSTTVTTPTDSSIVLGNTNTDGAVVTGNSAAGSPTGTVSFYECGPSASATPCTSQSNPVGGAEALTAGAGNTSSTGSVSFTPDSTGYWCFGAYYSGDSNYAASADTSTDECYDVTIAGSTTVTTPTNSSIVLGNTNTDGAVVTGNSAAGSPTGTVSFYECGPSASATPCTSQSNPVGSAETLTAGAGDTSTTNSVSFTPDSTGYWCFGAYYSGDSNYSPSADKSTDECFHVAASSSSTTSTPTHSSIVLGGTDSDGAVVTGNALVGSPTGTVTFYECGPGVTSCTSGSQSANQVGSAVTVTAGSGATSSAQSATFTPHQAGEYCFAAYYSGDSNYSGSSDTSTDECFEVTAAASTTTSNPASGNVAVGTTNYDDVTVAGNIPGGAPLGSVTFYYCGPEATATSCTSTNNSAGSASLSAGAGDASYASSPPITFSTAGTYCFAAVYTGSTNYTTSSDTATTECFLVGSPPKITSFTPTSGPVGTTVTIHGTNLSAATSVKFNGKAAVTIVSDTATKIKVKVPSGAKTGKIKVNTLAGSGTSATNFTVFP
jgi:hypothetical protein